MIAEVIKHLIGKAASVDVGNIVLEHPTALSHGDYASNIALVEGKRQGRSPEEFAEEIVQTINARKPEEIARVEVAGPGFINFHLSRAFLTECTNRIIKQGERWGTNKAFFGKKVMVEYTDPNLFKEFHIGHLMSNAIGESISRLMEFSGAEVTRANYQGDVGLHVAKAIWGLKQLHADGTDIKILGEAYGKGATAYEEEEKAKKEINAINKIIYEKSDVAIRKLYDSGRETSLSHFEELYKKLGTAFDHYFFESETGSMGMELIAKHKDVFEESEGAVVFRGERYDPKLHTRVFVTSQGLPTYDTKELGLAQQKFDTWDHDISISITGNEITDYFKVVVKALEQINPKLASKLTHIPHGMMRLPSGKMSSRKGDIVTAELLLAEVEEKVKEKMKDSGVKEVGVMGDVAVAALKYSILKQSTGKDIIFDLDQALSFEGDSGPYLQYTYARCTSVLKKAGDVSLGAQNTKEEPIELERLLCRFPEVVKRATHHHEPHYVTTYLTEIASSFNNWYAHTKILDGSSAEGHKLALTCATKITLQNGLHLLGIIAPPQM